MKVFYLTAFFFLLFLNLKGQTTTQKVNEKISVLKSNGIDTVLCSYVNCIGFISVFDDQATCHTDTTKYIFWTIKNKSFIQKFDNCNQYKEILIDSSLFHLINNNLTKIKSSIIKHPEFIEIIKGKKSRFSTFIDHSCHYIYEIHLKNQLIKKEIDDFYLKTKYIDDKFLNINYSYNQNSILKKLYDLVELEIKLLEQ